MFADYGDRFVDPAYEEAYRAYLQRLAARNPGARPLPQDEFEHLLARFDLLHLIAMERELSPDELRRYHETAEILLESLGTGEDAFEEDGFLGDLIDDEDEALVEDPLPTAAEAPALRAGARSRRALWRDLRRRRRP